MKNILFVQDSTPCIRTIKIADALQKNGMNIYLIHRNQTPEEMYGFGNSSFTSMIRLSKYNFNELKIIKNLISEKNIRLLHYHNEPDSLCAALISAQIKIPIIYDQHDFLSFKKNLSIKEKKFEKICNENAAGTIYITESYKNEVSNYYNLIENSICFSNYFPEMCILDEKSFLPKLSKTDGESHLVFIGRISENKSDHRNMLSNLKKLSENGFIIHVYPTKNKKYKKYRNIKNVRMHQKLPYNKLIREISQYDFGLTIFNNEVAEKLPHIKYAFGNKTYDYLCSGIPVIVQDCLDEVRNFIINNNFGFILENYKDYKNIFQNKYSQIVKNIIENRNSFSMQNQIHRIIDFYKKTSLEFNKNS